MKKFILSSSMLRRTKRTNRNIKFKRLANYSFSHGRISDEYSKMAPEFSEISRLEDNEEDKDCLEEEDETNIE